MTTTAPKIDHLTCAPGVVARARDFYEAYLANSDGKAWNGQPCPSWVVVRAAGPSDIERRLAAVERQPDAERLRNAMARAGFVMHARDAERIVGFYTGALESSDPGEPLWRARAEALAAIVARVDIEALRGDEKTWPARTAISDTRRIVALDELGNLEWR